MAEPVISVPVTELVALHEIVSRAATHLQEAEAELRRLAEEEFVSVRFRVAPTVPGALGAAAIEIKKWLQGAPPGTTGVSRL